MAFPAGLGGSSTDRKARIYRLDCSEGNDRIDATPPADSTPKVAFPPTCAVPDGYCERQVWGIFTHTPRRQPSAAERRFRPFTAASRSARRDFRIAV
jgi:hypothetical protein